MKFDHKINGFLEIVLEHLFVTFGDRDSIGVWT